MPDVFAEAADVIDARIGGGVDFENIKRGAFGYLDAGRAFAAGIRGGTVNAVNGPGQKPGGGCFAGTAGSAKEIAGADTAAFQAVSKGFRHMFLGDNIRKRLGSIFAGKDEIAHRWSIYEKIPKRGIIFLDRLSRRLSGKVTSVDFAVSLPGHLHETVAATKHLRERLNEETNQRREVVYGRFPDGLVVFIPLGVFYRVIVKSGKQQDIITNSDTEAAIAVFEGQSIGEAIDGFGGDMKHFGEIVGAYLTEYAQTVVEPREVMFEHFRQTGMMRSVVSGECFTIFVLAKFAGTAVTSTFKEASVKL